ncbi:hypothetical protein Tco_1028159, partial [Tanacetum coccineum]
GKTYDLSVNPNDQPNDFETPINFDSDDEDDEPTPQPVGIKSLLYAVRITTAQLYVNIALMKLLLLVKVTTAS